MRGNQLSRQWQILRTIESKKHGTTVAELASQEDCSPNTIWRDLAAIENAQLPLLFQFNPMRDSRDRREVQLLMRDLEHEAHFMTMEVEGLQEVMSWLMGFGRHAEVMVSDHLRQAVAEELAATTGKYTSRPLPDSVKGPEQRVLR